MALKKINNLVLIFIIICSTAFYKFSILGSIDRIAELMGMGIIFFSILLYVVYSDQHSLKRNFVLPVTLILFSLLPSMIMANYEHGQSFGHTLYAQRALYYYLVYFLLHQMKLDPKDLERIFLGLGIFYVFIYFLQVALYPTIIFDAYVRATRGTIRIYLPGSDYLAVSLFIGVQYFLRTNKMKYLVLSLLFFLVFILMGGRTMMAILVFTIALFIILDKKVKSRFFLIFLGIIVITAVFFMFQEIFEALILQSKKDTNTAEGYIRIRATRFFLKDFMDNSWTYITGHGKSYANSRYGAELGHYAKNYGFHLSDIGLFGNYVVYGLFFVIGVISICYRAVKIKIDDNYIYIKYIFLTIILSLLTSAGFVKADAICYFMILLYIIDVTAKSKINPVVPSQT